MEVSTIQGGLMLGTSDLVAFIPSTDLERARSFYQGQLGLSLKSENPFAAVFDANGTMLRVTAVDEIALAQYTVLGWKVADIVASVRALAGKGVSFLRFEGMEQDDLGVWTTPSGDRVAWFKDPDGNTLSLTELTGTGMA
jgi:catechol 2,3-dioxygenase-like lactoylglutathione lyase family enzyme